MARLRHLPSPPACARAALALALLVTGGAPVLPAQPPSYEHRVVVPTTSINRDAEIADSLEQNVNALAARGFELSALAGGDGVVLDAMLARSPYAPAVTDHAAVTLAVMTRPLGQPGIAREYRLLHVRERESVADAVAPLGPAGFRLVLVEHDGDVVHVAFEKVDGQAPMEYREFRNRGRRTWMDQLLADDEVVHRMTRVTPVALNAGIVELGPRQADPGHVQWLSRPTHSFEQLETPIRELVKGGHRVDLVRRRGPNDLDVLLVKPAGVTASTAVFDLDDGPWGSPCGRGTIAGAAVGPDGDVYCAADTAGSAPPSNRGLDLTVRPQPSASGAVLFRGPTCDVLARLYSARRASTWLAFAAQLEQEIASAAPAGFRVTRLLAAKDGNEQARLVAFTTTAAPRVTRGRPADASPVPALMAELDTPGNDLARQREVSVNDALQRRGLEGGPLWVEFPERGRTVRLLGCVPTRLARDATEAAVRGLLIGEGLGDYRLDSRLVLAR